MEAYIAEGISVLILIIAVCMMQFKNVKFILIGQIVANLLTASTYFLTGGFSGSGICIIAIIQTVTMFILNRMGKTPHLSVIILFILSYVACSIYYYQSIYDIFSAMAAVCFALSVSQKDSSKTRFWYLFNPVCWLIYDIFKGSYVLLITHLIIFISTLVAMIRVDGIFKKKMKTTEEKTNS